MNPLCVSPVSSAVVCTVQFKARLLCAMSTREGSLDKEWRFSGSLRHNCQPAIDYRGAYFLPASSFLTLSRYVIPLASSSWSKLWLSKNCHLVNTYYEQMLCWSGVGVLQEEGLSNRLGSLGVSFPPHSWSKHWPDWTQSQWGMGLLRLSCRRRIIVPCGKRSARDLEMAAIFSPFVFITYEQTLIKKILGGKALSFLTFFFLTFSS